VFEKQRVLTCKFGHNGFSYWLRSACNHAYKPILYEVLLLAEMLCHRSFSYMVLTSFPSDLYGEKCSESTMSGACVVAPFDVILSSPGLLSLYLFGRLQVNVNSLNLRKNFGS
jgi:hypothetical protein